jgi:adenine C2-methylase RlmN of 23S rRNA A2503 and tRNA A37
MEIIKSELDNSVNFVVDAEKGKFESRFVQRSPDYFIVYLSSQSGCNQGCRMCHLTNTKQTQFVNAKIKDYIDQATAVLNYYKENINKRVEKIHFNFMARGEALDNPDFLLYNAYIFLHLKNIFSEYTDTFRFNVSTIMPHMFLIEHSDSNYTTDSKLYRVFKEAFIFGVAPTFYYSLYSVYPEFRKRWLPKAMDHYKAFGMLKYWQDKTYLIPKIHFAFIENENDSAENVENLCSSVKASCLKANVNIVRYNPYSEIYGKESSESVIEHNAEIIRQRLNCNVDIIPKVGYDVKASCGMFVEKTK